MGKKRPFARKPFLASARQARATVRCQHCGFPDGARPAWMLGSIDMGGPWGWSEISSEQLARVMERLKALETMTWTGVQQGTGSHPVEKSKLVRAAWERLAEIQQDDIDELYSLWA
jgi:hypothetical protein